MTHAIQATLTIFSPETSSAILEKLDVADNFTHVTDTAPKDISSKAIALFCLDNVSCDSALPSITHIGIIHKQARVATSQVRLKCTNLIKLPTLAPDKLVESVDKKFKSYAKNAFSIGYKKVPSKTGVALFNAILKECPDHREQILKLASANEPKKIWRDSPSTQRLWAERDSLALSLDIFNADRAEILGDCDYDNISDGDSFLSGITSYTAREDDLIYKDLLHSLPGWEAISQNIAGVAEFENKEQERLVVINANRGKIEKEFGVDLIYFHRGYQAFTLIQYKMMDRSNKNDEIYYNPNNKGHAEELNRMQLLYDSFDRSGGKENLKNYRFSDCPIFFKLCPKKQMAEGETSISTGAYIPLSQWNLLINDKSTEGPNGGCQIGYHTLKKRYLGTGGFIELVQKGYVGTYAKDSTPIKMFIEGVLNSNHSLMVAVES